MTNTIIIKVIAIWVAELLKQITREAILGRSSRTILTTRIERCILYLWSIYLSASLHTLHTIIDEELIETRITVLKWILWVIAAVGIFLCDILDRLTICHTKVINIVGCRINLNTRTYQASRSIVGNLVPYPACVTWIFIEDNLLHTWQLIALGVCIEYIHVMVEVCQLVKSTFLAEFECLTESLGSLLAILLIIISIATTHLVHQW